MKEVIQTQNAPQAIGPYSQATCSGNFIFTSGQLPINPATGKIEEEDIEKQAQQSLENIKAILTQAGSGMDQILKTTVYLKDIEDFGKVNEIYKGFFSEGNYPARTAFEVGALPMGAGIEIEAVAVKP